MIQQPMININYNHIFQQITESLHHYYRLDVSVKTANGSNLFPEHQTSKFNGVTSYTIRFNPKVKTILSLYNRAMSDGEDIGETINLYTLFHAFLELNDYTNARKYLDAFCKEIDRLNLTHRSSEIQNEANVQILIQIYFLLMHEAFHTIFKHSSTTKSQAFDTTRELLRDIKTELDDQLSHISNKELLAHPKTQTHLSALIPSSLPQQEQKHMEAQLRKELEVHPYSTEYIDRLLNGEDEVLLEEMTCDRQAWLNLLSIFQEEDISAEDILLIHKQIFVVFCAMDFNFNLQSQYRPSCRNKYEYNGSRVVLRHKAFKTLLRQYNPETDRLINSQYLELHQGLEAIYRTSILGILNYENDFALLHQMYKSQSYKADCNLSLRLEKEMAKVADKL